MASMKFVVALLPLLMLFSPAHADTLDDAAIKAAMQFLDLDEDQLVDKGRRSVAVGPWAGGAVVGNTTRGVFGGSAHVGFGLYLFDDPLIDLGDLQRRLTVMAFKKITDEDFRRGDSEGRKQKIADLAREVKADIKARLKGEPTMWPKPKLVVNAEANLKLSNAQGNQIRAGAGFGIDRFSLGATVGAEFGGGTTSLLLGPEVGTYLFLGDGPRPWLLGLFARYDFRLTSANRNQTLSVGARLVFDLI